MICEVPEVFWCSPKVFWCSPKVFWESPELFWESPKVFWCSPKVFWWSPKVFWEAPKVFREIPNALWESPGAIWKSLFGRWEAPPGDRAKGATAAQGQAGGGFRPQRDCRALARVLDSPHAAANPPKPLHARPNPRLAYSPLGRITCRARARPINTSDMVARSSRRCCLLPDVVLLLELG